MQVDDGRTGLRRPRRPHVFQRVGHVSAPPLRIHVVGHQRGVESVRRTTEECARLKRLPVVNFAAGGIATPADAALMMQMGCDGVFVGSGIFKSGDAAKRAKAIVQATTHYNDPKVLLEVSIGLGEAMVGINCEKMPEGNKLAKRGW